MVTHTNNEFLKVFRGRRVFMTGDTGFKGSWLALWLTELGARVTGYALPPADNQVHFNVLGLPKMIRHIDGDVRDFNALNAAMRAAEPEFVFHLAAQALVRRSYREPKLTFDTNVGGTVNMLEAVRGADSVRSFVCITSDKCYRNKEWIWGYRENDELGGHDPYSASKAAAEIAFAAFRESFGEERPSLGMATTRAGNVIGGGDWSADRIVPDSIRALAKGEPITIRNPHATRPWQHVLEPLSGYLLLATRLAEHPRTYAGAWNFGPELNVGLTVGELVQGLVERWGNGNISTRLENAPGPAEDQLLQLNIDKAKLKLRWEPRWTIGQSLDRVVEWYKGALAGASVRDIGCAQIDAYTRIYA